MTRRLLLLLASTSAIACGARADLDPGGLAGGTTSSSTTGAACALPAESPPICPTGPATLVSQRGPVMLRADATHLVYTTSQGGPAGFTPLLEAVPLGGGAPATLYTYAQNANQVAWTLRGGAAYLNDGQGNIVKVPIDGGPTSILHTSGLPFRAWHFDADDSHLYFGERDNKAGTEIVYRLALEGGAPELLAQIGFTWGYETDFTPNQDIEIAVDGCHVYWLHKPTIPMNGGTNHDGAVYLVDKVTGANTLVFAGLSNPYGLTLTDDAIWVFDEGEYFSPPNGRLIGKGKDGSERMPLSFEGVALTALALDTAAAIHGRYGPPEDLNAKTGWWTRPLDGSAPASLITSAPLPEDGGYAPLIDRACRMLYSVTYDDAVRQPIP